MYEKKFISTAEAAKIAGVTSATIRNVAKAGAIAYRMRNHLFLVSREDVEKYAATISDIHPITTEIDEYKKALYTEHDELNAQLDAMRIKYHERMLNMEMFPKRIEAIREFLFAVLEGLSRYVDFEDFGVSRREWNTIWEALQGKTFEEIGSTMTPRITKQRVSQVWQKGLRKIVLAKGTFDHLNEEIDMLKKILQVKNDEIAGLHAHLEDKNIPVIDDKTLNMSKLLATDIHDCDLSVRATKCLECADIHTIRDLVKYYRTDLLKFRNFGKKSLTELDEFLESNGLHFQMDVDTIPEYVDINK